MWNKYQGLIFVISGPSGSGKTTLLKEILKDRGLKKKLFRSISFTTRSPRSKERQGQDYFFISEQAFKRKLKAKKLLEWTRYLGYYYGTSKEYLRGAIREGKNLILCLDRKGALKIRHLFPANSRLIFVSPPSITDLKDRIRQRCNKTRQEEISRRIKLAKAELAAAKVYDYCIVNKDLSTAIKKIKAIIAEQLRKA